MKYLLVGIGGYFGSISRYKITQCISRMNKKDINIATFSVNIIGAILLGIIVGSEANNNIYALAGDGFLGAFTTFSTFMYEDVNLIRDNKKKSALLYIILSMVLGILGFIIGKSVWMVI